jgi:hypothetical protein
LLVFGRRGEVIFLPEIGAELGLGPGKTLTTGKEEMESICLVKVVWIDFYMGVVGFIVVIRRVDIVSVGFVWIVKYV